jgi:hypothetical protein
LAELVCEQRDGPGRGRPCEKCSPAQHCGETGDERRPPRVTSNGPPGQTEYRHAPPSKGDGRC